MAMGGGFFRRDLWLKLAAVAMLAGCDGTTEHTPPGNGAPTGGYSLVAPFVAFEGQIPDPEGGFALRVVATQGSLELAGDSTYEHRLSFETYIDGQLSAKPNWFDKGRWIAEGDSLHFDSDYVEGLSFRGVSGNQGVTLVQDLVGEGTVAGYPFQRESD